MTEFFHVSPRVTRLALLTFLSIQLAACSSKEEQAKSYYDRGIKLASEHDDAKAAIELRNAVKLKKDYLEAWRALAKIDESRNDWARVVTDLRTILELAPHDVSTRLKLGKLLLLAGLPNESLALASAGLDQDFRNPDLHALKAAAALKLEDRAVAVQEAQTAIGIDPVNADALMVLAVDRLGNGDPKGALSLLERVSGTDAKNLEANVGLHLLKIRIFGQTGDLKNVEATLKKLVELNPQESGYRKLLVNFYVEQQRIHDAESEMRKLVADNPTDSNTALELIRFLYASKKDRAAARRELNNLISAASDAFPFQTALADMDIAEGNLTAGTQLLETLIASARTPERKQTTRARLARMHLGQANFGAAEKLAGDILRDDPRNVAALTIRATIYLERSQPDAAAADLVNALGSEPRSVEIMSRLATAYERSGLIELADKQLADATRASDFNPRIGIEYAEFLQRRGSLARAEDVLAGSFKRQPDNVPVLSALAQLRLNRQNWSGAQEIAESLRRTNGNDRADQILSAALIGQGRFEDAIAVLQTHDWPGNVRELRNNIERLMILVRDDDVEAPITADLLPSEIGDVMPRTPNQSDQHIMALPLREARELFEKEYLIAQINRFGGNISRTAEFIGMERSALHRKLKSLGV